jgi:hypothetical protein
MKKVVRLTESDINRIVKKVINENINQNQYPNKLKSFLDKLGKFYLSYAQKKPMKLVSESGTQRVSVIFDEVSSIELMKRSTIRSIPIDVLPKNSDEITYVKTTLVGHVASQPNVRVDTTKKYYIEFFTDYVKRDLKGFKISKITDQEGREYNLTSSSELGRHIQYSRLDDITF